jgi:hypothetical protein
LTAIIVTQSTIFDFMRSSCKSFFQANLINPKTANPVAIAVPKLSNVPIKIYSKI